MEQFTFLFVKDSEAAPKTAKRTRLIPMIIFHDEEIFTNQLPLLPPQVLFQNLVNLESKLGTIFRQFCLFFDKPPNCLLTKKREDNPIMFDRLINYLPFEEPILLKQNLLLRLFAARF